MGKNTRVSNFLLASLVAFLLLTGTTDIRAQSSNKQNSDRQALTELVKQMVNAQTNFDTPTLEKVYAADFIEISPVGEVDSREKTIGFYKPEANPDRDKMKAKVTTDEFSIRIYDNFAIVIARITCAQTASEPPAARPPFSLRVTLVCHKEKGSWKINSAQYTGIRPPLPQSSK